MTDPKNLEIKWLPKSKPNEYSYASTTPFDLLSRGRFNLVIN